jgi:ankyrin repeat protein
MAVHKGITVASAQDKEERQLMESAIAQGNAGDVRRLLAKGVSASGSGPSGLPYLIQAIQARSKKVVVALAHAGADGSVKGSDGVGAIPRAMGMFANEQDLLECLPALAKAGASVAAKNRSGEPPLVSAMGRGWSATMQALLELGAKPDVGVEGASPPLARAIDERRLDWVEMLLEHGASGLAKDDRGLPMICKALGAFKQEEEFIRCARALMKHGANPKAKDAYGRAPVILALDRGWGAALEALLQGGADPQVENPDGNPALGVAIEARRQDWVKFLLDAGADPKAKDRHGMPLSVKAFASFSQEEDFCRCASALFEHGASPKVKDAYGSPLIIKAMAKGWSGALFMLLRHGADPDAAGPDGNPALVLAIEARSLAWIKALAKAGAQGQASDRHGARLGPKAFDSFKKEEEFIEAIKMLCAAGAAPSAKDLYGVPLLIKVMARGWGSAAAELLALGAVAKCANAGGDSALAIAIDSNRLDWVKMLAQAGADCAGSDRHGLSLMAKLFGAVKTESDWMAGADVLVAHGASFNAKDLFGAPVLIKAMERGWGNAVRQALKGGAKPDVANASGDRPMAKALEARRIDWVRLLAAAGADGAGSDRQGVPWGVKARECMRQQDEFIVCWRALLAAGASPNSKDLYGKPLIVALAQNDWFEAARLALGAGANPNARDNAPSSALDCAIERKSARWVRLLASAGADVSTSDRHGVKVAIRAQAAGLSSDLTQAAMPMEAAMPWDALGEQRKLASELSKKVELAEIAVPPRASNADQKEEEECVPSSAVDKAHGRPIKSEFKEEARPESKYDPESEDEEYESEDEIDGAWKREKAAEAGGAPSASELGRRLGRARAELEQATKMIQEARAALGVEKEKGLAPALSTRPHRARRRGGLK